MAAGVSRQFAYLGRFLVTAPDCIFQQEFSAGIGFASMDLDDYAAARATGR
jgi:hypothetical protein